MKRIRINNVTMPIRHSQDELFQKCAKIAGLQKNKIKDMILMRRSIDARKKPNLFYVYTVDLIISSKQSFRKGKDISEVIIHNYRSIYKDAKIPVEPIAVIGAGPAGLFCAYILALNGLKPHVFERGKAMDERSADVEHFWETGILDTESNVQFGEGGAGTFSDGKLNTQVKDKFGRNRFVLETFVKFGAPEEILYDAKPHIGTDVLKTVIVNMRNAIIDLGGAFHFESKLTSFQSENGAVSSITINDRDCISVSALFLCIGHSARDTFAMLYEKSIPMEPKAFAVGYRIEHPQSMIDDSQYGENHDSLLPVAPYKLTYHAKDGRGVYSFCMCPGGHVVNASSYNNMLAVNGMSYHDRDSGNANSALVITVQPEDFEEANNPLSGIKFQEQLEKKAYALANGSIPQQLLGDFKANQISKSYGSFPSKAKGKTTFANLRNLMPEILNLDLIEAIDEGFGRKIKGFNSDDAILSGIESRTSSPLRILRNELFELSISGIYPCGEGAGYAGGITSAAMDGLKCAEKLLEKLSN